MSRMRLVQITCLTVGCLGSASVASARVTQTADTRTYAVSGNSGAALLDAMDRAGPRHGFLARAIAQTKYKVDWVFDIAENNGVCRVRSVDAKLALTFIYPQATGRLPPALDRRWRAFIAGARQHEQGHARLARQMVDAAEAGVSTLAMSDNPACTRTRRQVKQTVDRITAAYEARQVAYDAREHRPGGKVDQLINRLVDGR